MHRKIIAAVLVLVMALLLCSCTSHEEEYEKAFFDGWESAMAFVEESGVSSRAEEARYYLEAGDLDEVDNYLSSIISACYEAQHENPRYHLP